MELKEYLQSSQISIAPQSYVVDWSATSLQTLNMWNCGIAEETPPESKSQVIGAWIYHTQGRMTRYAVNSKEWRDMLVEYWDTEPDAKLELARIETLLFWVFNDLIPCYPPLCNVSTASPAWSHMVGVALNTKRKNYRVAYHLDTAICRLENLHAIDFVNVTIDIAAASMLLIEETKGIFQARMLMRRLLDAKPGAINLGKYNESK